MTNPEETMEERFLKKWEQVFFYDRDTLGHPYLKCTEKVLAFIRSELLLQHENDYREIEKIINIPLPKNTSWASAVDDLRREQRIALEKMKGEA
jgi:hypothetical protein